MNHERVCRAPQGRQLWPVLRLQKIVPALITLRPQISLVLPQMLGRG